MTMTLHIRDVSKTYPNGVQALKHVTLVLPAGVCGLVGPRGAGKSTLLRLLAGMQDADTGSIQLGNLDLRTHRDHVRKKRAYLPQDFMTQRKATADRLLAHGPSLVIVDEPGLGLEPSQRERLERRLRELAGRAVIIVAAERIEEVAGLCTRMAILCDGRVVLDRDREDALSALSGRVWHRVISHEALPRVEREYAVISARPVAGGVAVRVYSHTPPAVGFEQDDPRLDDVYERALRLARHPARDVEIKEPLFT